MAGEWGRGRGRGLALDWCRHLERLRLAWPHAPQILGVLVVRGIFSPVISACPCQNHLQSPLKRKLPEPCPDELAQPRKFPGS